MQKSLYLDSNQVAVPKAVIQALPEPQHVIFRDVLMRFEPACEQIEASLPRIVVRTAECSK